MSVIGPVYSWLLTSQSAPSRRSGLSCPWRDRSRRDGPARQSVRPGGPWPCGLLGPWRSQADI